MEIMHYRRDALDLFEIRGEVDLPNAPKLRAILHQHVQSEPEIASRPVVLGLREVAYMDSTGVAAVLASREMITGKRGRLYLLEPRKAVIKILKLTRLDTLFDVCDSEDALKRAIGPL